MVVWTGKGVLAVVILVACFALFANVLPKEQEDYAFVVSFIITGVFSWVMGKNGIRRKPELLSTKHRVRRFN